MSPAIALALKKQRLQIRSAALRVELAGHATAVAPLLAAGDKLREGARWLGRHREIVAAVAVALLVARPRAALRWTRRGVVAWQAWRRASAWLRQDRCAP